MKTDIQTDSLEVKQWKTRRKGDISIFDPKIIRAAIPESFKKLEPRVQLGCPEYDYGNAQPVGAAAARVWGAGRSGWGGGGRRRGGAAGAGGGSSGPEAKKRGSG